MNNFNPSRMTQEQVQDLVRPLLMSTGTFSSWLKSTAVTARHHSMNSPRLYRLERKKDHLFRNWFHLFLPFIFFSCSHATLAFSPCLQKVLASRKELLEYDLQQREAATKSSRSSSSHQPTFTASQYRALSVLGCGHTSSNKCYGCASAVTGHCITLLRALATNPALRQILVLQGLIRELFEYNLRRGTAAMREEVRQLVCLLTRYVPPSHVQL